ncbi:hypothetical protein ACX93W_00520 [Paenibacillus sp. CAU 1782]
MNFHPTVFENIKVALENELYDMDNLDGLVTVSGRSDRRRTDGGYSRTAAAYGANLERAGGAAVNGLFPWWDCCDIVRWITEKENPACLYKLNKKISFCSTYIIAFAQE